MANEFLAMVYRFSVSTSQVLSSNYSQWISVKNSWVSAVWWWGELGSVLTNSPVIIMAA